MVLIKRTELTNDKWMTWIETSPVNCEIVYFDHQPTETEAQTFLTLWNVEHLYDAFPQIPISIYDAKDAIESAVIYIKTTTSLTLTKWNAYIDSIGAENGYAVKWFIMVMARKLSEQNNITLSLKTETEILGKMKTWFINTPANKIKKIFYGE